MDVDQWLFWLLPHHWLHSTSITEWLTQGGLKSGRERCTYVQDGLRHTSHKGASNQVQGSKVRLGSSDAFIQLSQ